MKPSPLIRFGSAALRAAVGLIAASTIVDCTDERTPPAAPDQPGYTQTVVLFQDDTHAGTLLSGTVTPRDSVVSARLYLSCTLQPDDSLRWFERLADELDSLATVKDSLTIMMVNLSGNPSRTPAEDSLLAQVMRDFAFTQVEIDRRHAARDVLDVFLDDRFHVGVRLDADTVDLYPQAVFVNRGVTLNDALVDTAREARLTRLRIAGYDTARVNPADPASPLLDSAAAAAEDTLRVALEAARAWRDSLAGALFTDTMVWGQGFYLAPAGTDGWRGRTLTLDLSRFMVADGGWDIGGPYYHPSRPARGATYSNQYPITDWRTRLTPRSPHRIYVRFGAADARVKVTATLYLVYAREA